MKHAKGKILLFFLFLVPIALFFLWKNAEERFTPLELYGDMEADSTITPWTLRDFTLINQDSDTLHLKDLEDKIIVANFFYATCPTICPQMNSNLRLSVEKYRDQEDVVFISHTVNPHEDNVDTLKEYSNRYGYATDKWHFVTGYKSEIYDLAKNSYHVVTAAPSGENDFIHSTTIVLIDKERRVRGFYESNNNPMFYKELKDGIRVLLREYHMNKAKPSE
jgi:protein SCO1